MSMEREWLELTWDTPRIDRLSRTPEERERRYRSALHEAHHLMGSVLYNCGVGTAYIPRPGESPPLAGGAAASIITTDLLSRTIPSVVLSLMGPAAEALMHGSARSSGARADWEEIDELRSVSTQRRYEVYALTPELERELKRRAWTIALGYASEIDLAACVMLDRSTKKNSGEVSYRKMNELYKWLRKLVQEETGASRQRLDRRRLYINTRESLLTGLKGPLLPPRMKKYRRLFDRATTIAQSDFERYGLVGREAGR